MAPSSLRRALSASQARQQSKGNAVLHSNDDHMAEDLAEKIRKLRKTLGMTQVQFAHRLAVSQGVVSRWERGSHMPQHDALHRLAELAGLSVGEFHYGLASRGDGEAKQNALPAGAWGRRVTDHISAAIRRAKDTGNRDVAAALSIILEKCEHEAERYRSRRRMTDKLALETGGAGHAGQELP